MHISTDSLLRYLCCINLFVLVIDFVFLFVSYCLTYLAYISVLGSHALFFLLLCQCASFVVYYFSTASTATSVTCVMSTAIKVSLSIPVIYILLVSDFLCSLLVQ